MTLRVPGDTFSLSSGAFPTDTSLKSFYSGLPLKLAVTKFHLHENVIIGGDA